MDSFRKIRTKVFPDKAQRNKIVRRSASLPQILHPMYFGSTPLTVDKINVDVPLNYYNNPGSTGVYDIARHPEKIPRQNAFNNSSSTKSPTSTKPTTKPTHVNTSKPTYDSLNKPLPVIQRQPPNRVPRTVNRKAEKPVPVPMPILKPLTATHVYHRDLDLIDQFPSPPASSRYQDSRLNAINHAEKEPLLARQIRRPTDPADYIPPPIPAFDSRSRIREIRIQMEEADRDPFRHIIPIFAAAGSTPNLFRSASTSSRTVKQDLPESWSELGDWTGYRASKPPVPEPIHKAREATLLMRHNNISSKSLGPNVVFKDSPARRPVLVHKKSSSFATPGHWPEPNHHARLQSNASAPPPMYRSGSRRLPRVGDNTSRTRPEDEIMQSTGSARSVQSNISSLSRAKKLPRPPLERNAQSSNMLSTGSAKSFMSLGSNVAPRVTEKLPSRNVLKKLTKPNDSIAKSSSSSNMLSTGSARSFFSMRSNLIPESERKPRPVIKLPTALRPFKRPSS